MSASASASTAAAVDITDIGVPMPPSQFAMFTSVDLTGIKHPKYGKKKNFNDLKNQIRYKGFRHDLNSSNKGVVVLGRKVTEAAWIQVLLKYYKYWRIETLTKKYGAGNEMRHKKMMLVDAVMQVNAHSLPSDNLQSLIKYIAIWWR